MRRFARHLFTLCSAVSLLVCVAVCVLWVRSYFSPDSVERLAVYSDEDVSIGGGDRLYSVSGVIVWAGYRRKFFADRPPDEVSWTFWHPSPFSKTAFDGSARGRWHMTRDRLRPGGVAMWHTYHILVPHLWLIGGLAVFPTAFLIWRVRILQRYARRRRNLCAHCGYDLRASPGRCPECGALPAG